MRNHDVIKVQGVSIAVEDDYICLTDMVKVNSDESKSAKTISNWLRNRSTIEFLGVWEMLNNPQLFKVLEFEGIKNSAGLKTFSLSVTEWVNKTEAVGIYSKAGKQGGTFAHKDIAFEFGAAISPTFKLYLIKEFQRLKEIENNSNNVGWNVHRLLCKAQYHVQTDAVKNFKIPISNLHVSKHFIAYAEEGDILNLAMWGFTAKQWREANVQLAAQGRNVREYASINELMVLSSLEGINAEMLKENIAFDVRLKKLVEVRKSQLITFERVYPSNSMRKNVSGEFVGYLRTDGTMFPSRQLNA
ncbi:MAG: KilA-N domain-containing protein [Parafilimonas sp.]